MLLRMCPSYNALHPVLKQLDTRSILAYDSTQSSHCMSRSASMKVDVHRSNA